MSGKAIVTTLDNLPTLKETIAILREDRELDGIVVVNNGSIDGTREWLDAQSGLAVVHRENKGAGPGRNAGLDVAGPCDWYLLLDGGIRPLRRGTGRMLAYMKEKPSIDVLGLEIPDFETDHEKAWRRWPHPITNSYRNTRLSHTAYCIARHRAFDGIRFSEEGPFGEPGWGADDDELAYQWLDRNIVVHVVTGVHPYRRASGSFRRLHRETGIWPNQYGSVYEKRVVWLKHHWPQYQPPGQWGEPWLTVVVKVGNVEETARIIKATHERLRTRRFREPWQDVWQPYSVVAWDREGNEKWARWAEPRYLRQHHGDRIIVDGEIVRRAKQNEQTWTGDFSLWSGDDWQGGVREGAYYYGLVESMGELERLFVQYDEIWPYVSGAKREDPIFREEIAICQPVCP